MMTTITTLAVREIDGEPRVLDTDLGTALGMPEPRMNRRTIKEHEASLAQLGEVCAVREQTGPKGGRPSTAYWLNEEQATYVTMHLRTAKAQSVKVQIVKVFTAWRHGKLVPAQPALPNFNDPIAAAETWLVEAKVIEWQARGEH